jgi:hypothetical protein
MKYIPNSAVNETSNSKLESQEPELLIREMGEHKVRPCSKLQTIYCLLTGKEIRGQVDG